MATTQSIAIGPPQLVRWRPYHALAELLDIDDTDGHAVLTLRWSSFTRARQRQARDDLDDIRRAIAALER